jgi:D-3-phosphoglycerate dehydrogenase
LTAAEPALVVQTECDLFPSSSLVAEIVEAAGFRFDGIPTGMESVVAEHARHADAVVVGGFQADAEFLDGLERCRVIARCGVGIDNVDVQGAHERGMVVTYVPDFCTDEVAEHALALMLACERRVASSDRSIRAQSWPRYAELGPMRRMRGLTVGIVGLGRIGTRVAELVDAIGMHAIAHDPYRTGDLNGAPATLTPLDELLVQTDILSLHLPLTEGTIAWLDGEKLGSLRPGATVINTARGGVADEAALLEALEDGRVRAAGLDVFEGEPSGLEQRLIAHPNVVSTPHSAALSDQSLDELFRSAAEDVVRVLNGESPLNPVTSELVNQ